MIKKIYKALSIILLFICTAVFSGCWDYTDVDRRGIYTSIGIDKLKGGIEITSESAGFKTSLSKGENKAELGIIHVISSNGINFEEARFNDDLKTPFPIFLGAVKTVVFSQNYAKDGIFPYINRINRLYDYRKTILPVVSREPPKEMFNLTVSNDLSPGFLIEDIVRTLNQTGKGIYVTFKDILNFTSLKEIGFILPYVGIESGLISYLGFAVINEQGKLIDVIDSNNSKGLIYLLSDNPKLTESSSLGDNSNLLSTTPISFKRKVKTEYIDDKVIINIDLKLKEKLEYTYKETSLSHDDLIMLENILSNKIKGYIVDTISKAQEDYKCDIFQFLRYFRAQNPKAYKTIDWKEKFPKAEVNVNVDVKIASVCLYDYKANNKK